MAATESAEKNANLDEGRPELAALLFQFFFLHFHVRHKPLKAGSATGWVNSSTRREPVAAQARKTRLEGRAIASISWSLNEDGLTRIPGSTLYNLENSDS